MEEVSMVCEIVYGTYSILNHSFYGVTLKFHFWGSVHIENSQNCIFLFSNLKIMLDIGLNTGLRTLYKIILFIQFHWYSNVIKVAINGIHATYVFQSCLKICPLRQRSAPVEMYQFLDVLDSSRLVTAGWSASSSHFVSHKTTEEFVPHRCQHNCQ